ncbi:hypothetical protein NKG94_26535 [Micromonospora sp. M12]
MVIGLVLPGWWRWRSRTPWCACSTGGVRIGGGHDHRGTCRLRRAGAAGRGRRSTYAVATLVVVGASVLGAAALVGDGRMDADNLLAAFAMILIPSLVGAVAALVSAVG